MMGKASGLPDVATTPMASSVSENSSLANLATASSNGPANAGKARVAIKKTERTSARTRSKTLATTGRPRQNQWEGGDIAALQVSWINFLSLARSRGKRLAFAAILTIMLPFSGALTAALVGLGVVVAALLADPVADQVLGIRQLLRPGVAGNQTGRLPHHVELAIGFDFANEHRLGDVVVRKQFRRATGQIRRLGA